MATQDSFTIADRYTIRRKIGSGSFGDIYVGYDKKRQISVAIKVEDRSIKYPQLQFESRVYQSMRNVPGIPVVHWYGTIDKHNFMVMDLMGESLESLFNKCGRKFSLKTVLMLAVQMLDRIEYHHENNYVHRDIKPENFVMGQALDTCHIVHLIDMGLCKRYRDPISQEHIAYVENKKLTGTPRYASINAHRGREQSRRDDLESLGYMLLYFLVGKLPWQGLPGANKHEKYERIGQKKKETNIEDLCMGQPKEFVDYLRYCRLLKFEEQPDYGYLRSLFMGLFQRKNYAIDFVFDWMAEDVLNHKITPPLPYPARYRFNRMATATPAAAANNFRLPTTPKTILPPALTGPAPASNAPLAPDNGIFNSMTRALERSRAETERWKDTAVRTQQQCHSLKTELRVLRRQLAFVMNQQQQEGDQFLPAKDPPGGNVRKRKRPSEEGAVAGTPGAAGTDEGVSPSASAAVAANVSQALETLRTMIVKRQASVGTMATLGTAAAAVINTIVKHSPEHTGFDTPHASTADAAHGTNGLSNSPKFRAAAAAATPTGGTDAPALNANGTARQSPFSPPPNKASRLYPPTMQQPLMPYFNTPALGTAPAATTTAANGAAATGAGAASSAQYVNLAGEVHNVRLPLKKEKPEAARKGVAVILDDENS